MNRIPVACALAALLMAGLPPAAAGVDENDTGASLASLGGPAFVSDRAEPGGLQTALNLEELDILLPCTPGDQGVLARRYVHVYGNGGVWWQGSQLRTGVTVYEVHAHRWNYQAAGLCAPGAAAHLHYVSSYDTCLNCFVTDVVAIEASPVVKQA